MIVSPDFFEHWKTKALIELTNRPESPLWLQRLWAHCQTRKESVFRDLSDLALKSICSVPAEITPEVWKKHLLDAGFIKVKGKTLIVHEWDQVNASLVQRWESGRIPKKKRETSGAEAGDKRTASDRDDGLDKIGGEGKRARRGLGLLPSEQPDPIKSRMETVARCKNRLGSTRWSAGEVAAFKAAGLDRCTDEEFAEQAEPLLAYYTAPVALLHEFWGTKASDGKGDFRRRDLATLLNNWAGEVDRAGAWHDFKSKNDEQSGSSRL